jgi:hypothetical protein
MVLVLAGVVVALLTGEVVVRALIPAPPKPRVTEPLGFSPFERTPKGLTVYKPGAAFAHVSDTATDRSGYFGAEGRVEYRINNLGFRGPDIAFEKPANVRRILCLGDSFTFGEGVRESDAWPRQLETLLGANTQVINAGIQGYDLDSEGLLLLLHGRPLKPDVVIIGFFMNDAMPFGETAAHHVAVTETPAALSWLGRRSALWGFFERRHLAALETDRYLESLRASFKSEGWREAKGRIPRLRQMADHDGFTIVVVIFPLLYNLEDGYPLEREHAEVRRAFGDAGIDVVDLLEPYRRYRAENLWAHPVDPHPNRLAHQLAAESVARFLAARN